LFFVLFVPLSLFSFLEICRSHFPVVPFFFSLQFEKMNFLDLRSVISREHVSYWLFFMAALRLFSVWVGYFSYKRFQQVLFNRRESSCSFTSFFLFSPFLLFPLLGFVQKPVLLMNAARRLTSLLPLSPNTLRK
jgi:hypothetical protein